MTSVAIGDIQRTQGTLKTVYNAKKPLEAHLQVQMIPLNQIKQTNQNNQSQIHLAILKKTPNLKVST